MVMPNTLTFKSQTDLLHALYHLGRMQLQAVYSGGNRHQITLRDAVEAECAKQILKEKTWKSQ